MANRRARYRRDDGTIDEIVKGVRKSSRGQRVRVLCRAGWAECRS